MPRVSVVIPAFNAARFIDRAIGSVLSQTWTDIEVLVVDDGSTDDTVAVLRRYGRHVTLIQQRNAGPAAARNRGLQAAVGEFVAFLDADDWWEQGKLTAQVELLDTHPDIGFCSTATRVVDASGRKLADWPCLDSASSLPDAIFANGAAISGSTSGVLARRSVLIQAGGFNEALRGFEDPDLWIRLSAMTRYACISTQLTVVERTPGSVSSNFAAMRAAMLASYRGNRALLPPAKQGAFWRACCAGALTDLAKSAWRAGDRRTAAAWLLEALVMAPLGRGKLALSLLVTLAMRRTP
jgi:hypothetical protein